MCKHKKSGCVCFIVARLRASALRNRDIEDNKALCAPTDPTAKLRIHARTRKSFRNKTEIFFSIELSAAQNAGERNKTARPSQQTRELFSIFSPTPLVAASSNSFAPDCSSHTPARVYAHSAVFRLLPSPFTTSPYFSQYVTIRGEGFAFVRSSPSSPEKRISTHPIFSCKASSVGGSTWVNFCLFSSFTGTFTRILLILCNLQPIDFSKLGEAKNGPTSPLHPFYSVDNERIHSQCVKR